MPSSSLGTYASPIPSSSIHRHLSRQLLILRGIPRHNQLLHLLILIHKLPLTNMLPLLARNPHLILKLPPPLPLLMLERTLRIQARVELTHRLDMRKRAPLLRTIRAVATQPRRRVAERTPRVRAVGEELAVLLGVVGEFLRR